MRIHRAAALAFLSYVSWLYPVPSAKASPAAPARDQARALADRAANAFAQGNYAEADQLLLSAFQHYPAPTIALLHARTLVRLQRWVAAQQAYERATLASLASDAPPAFHAAVADATLEGRALSRRIPRVQIELARGLSRASVRRVDLDGRALSDAELGRFVSVDPGRHHVRAESVDGASATQTLRVGEQDATVVVIDLPVSRSPSDAAWVWGSLSLGGAGVIAGIATGVVAMQAHSSARGECGDVRWCVEGSAGARDVARFRQYRTLSTLGYAVGAVGLGVGTYLLVRMPSESPVVQLTVSSRPGAIEVGGVF